MAPESFPGPEPFTHYGKHVGQALEGLADSDNVFALPFVAVLGAVPFGTLSYLGLTKAVWRISHRGKQPPAEGG